MVSICYPDLAFFYSELEFHFFWINFLILLFTYFCFMGEVDIATCNHEVAGFEPHLIERLVQFSDSTVTYFQMASESCLMKITSLPCRITRASFGTTNLSGTGLQITTLTFIPSISLPLLWRVVVTFIIPLSSTCGLIFDMFPFINTKTQITIKEFCYVECIQYYQLPQMHFEFPKICPLLLFLPPISKVYFWSTMKSLFQNM